jgi:NTP pyrophosphatase (non-canonical NTP hydrolase)
MGPDLDTLLLRQERVQRGVYGVTPSELEGRELAEYIRLNVLAATDELHEVLGEVGWKPWKTEGYGTVRRPEYVGELADVLLFVFNLAAAQGVTGDELTEALRLKWAENRRRQQDGY